MRSRAMPGSFWDSTASKLITGITLLLATAPPNGIADLRDKEIESLLCRPNALCFMFLAENNPMYHVTQTPSHTGGNVDMTLKTQSGHLILTGPVIRIKPPGNRMTLCVVNPTFCTCVAVDFRFN